MMKEWISRRMQSSSGPKYIQFADSYVEGVCVSNWGDGVCITVAQAAAVPYSSTAEKNAFWNAFDGSLVTSFDELDYFKRVTDIPGNKFKNNTNLTSIGLTNIKTILNAAFSGCTALAIELNMPNFDQSSSFYDTFKGSGIRKVVNLGGTKNIGSYGFAQACTSLTEVTLPSTLTSISRVQFYGCTALTRFVCLATTPPSASNNFFNTYPTGFTIYVPYSADHSILNAYKTASYWSNYASYMTELNPDGSVPNI